MVKTKVAKAFVAFVIVICLAITTDVISYLYVIYSGVYHHAAQAHSLFALIFYPGLFILEAVIYWLIKNKITSHKLVWVHTLCMAVTFVVLPFLIMLLNHIGDTITDGISRHNFFLRERYFHAIIFWVPIIIGHAFFIATIAKSFRKKEPAAEDNEQSTGILDEFADEY